MTEHDLLKHKMILKIRENKLLNPCKVIDNT